MEERVQIFDIEALENVGQLKNASRVILYGAAEKGQRIHRLLNGASIAVHGFCDRDSAKWGTTIDGLGVLSPGAVRRDFAATLSLSKPAYVIGCIQSPQEAYDLLNDLFSDMENGSIRFISYWAIETALCFHRNELFAADSPEMRMYHQHQNDETVFWSRVYMDVIKLYASANAETICVLQAGKVGSWSIFTFFKDAQVPVIHQHFITPPKHKLGNFFKNEWLDAIAHYRQNGMKIITAVREPLARDYSAFWEPLPKNHFFCDFGDKIGNWQSMYEFFIDLVIHSNVGMNTKKYGVSMPYVWSDEFRWFDEQILAALDIDVYKYPFDRERGFGIIHEDGVDIFIYKLEKLNDLMPELSEFAGYPTKLLHRNVASEKKYSMAYQEFRKRVRLPMDYVNHYYVGNEKMDHFYTPEEKAAFLKQWEGNIVGD